MPKRKAPKRAPKKPKLKARKLPRWSSKKWRTMFTDDMVSRVAKSAEVVAGQIGEPILLQVGVVTSKGLTASVLVAPWLVPHGHATADFDPAQAVRAAVESELRKLPVFRKLWGIEEEPDGQARN